MYDILHQYIRNYVAITAEDWAFLAPFLIKKQLKKKEEFLSPGQICRHITFIEQGLVRAYEIMPEGQEVSVYFGFEQTFVTNYWSLLKQDPSRMVFHCLEPTTVIHLPYEAVQRGYEGSKRWERFGRMMAEQVYMMEIGRRNDMNYKSPTERYEYIEEHYPSWLDRIPQRYLASYLGITPESLSRLRKRRIK